MRVDGDLPRKNFVDATVFSDPDRGVVMDMAPGRETSAVLLFASLWGLGTAVYPAWCGTIHHAGAVPRS